MAFTTPPDTPYESAALWRGGELDERPGWRSALTLAEVDEIRSALVASEGVALEELSPERFPLPTLGPRLADLQKELEEGVGSALWSGWPAHEYSTEDNERVFWGVSSHLGTPISQSATGERIFRVEDAGFGRKDPRTRGPNTNNKLSFHCDRCDVIGFLCVRPAKAGGENYLVSTVAVHNEILARRPDLLAELYRPFYYKTHNVDRANPEPWCRQPIFGIVEGHFVGYLLRVLIDRAYEMPELPDMTPEQREALDLIDEIAADPTFHYSFRQEAGDLLFVNNFVNLHSRSAFDDHDDPERRRLLLRIWLSMPNSRPLPAKFAGAFGRVGAGEIRGGIHPA